MGGIDKGLVEYLGRPLIEYVSTVLAPQVGTVIVNANRNLDRYRRYGDAVVSDIVGDFAGPLAGMASGMQRAQTPLVVFVPCDSPLIGDDLVARLHEALVAQRAQISVAHDGHRLHPVFALVRTDLLPSALDYLERGERKIDQWFAGHRVAITDFSDRPTMFLNLNAPDDIEKLERAARRSDERNV